MKRGSTTIELDITYLFNEEGDADLDSLCLGSRELPKQLAKRLLDWMGAKVQEHQVNQCWENAEPAGDDDVASDEARVSGAA
jgi:hypothetical protein